MSATDNSNGRTLRADLIAANIYQRMVGDRTARVIGGDPTYITGKFLREAASVAFNAAAAFVAESRRRDPNTGELIHPTDGLPKEE